MPYQSRFKVGDSAAITMKVTDQMVREFARFSGDDNPIHLDDAYAAKTRFKKRIAHGAILGALLSRVAGTKLPGHGTIVISQEMRYKEPCYIDDTVTAEITIAHMRADKPVIKVASRVINQHGATLIEGGAILYFDAVE